MLHSVIHICTQHILCNRKLTEIAGQYQLCPEAVPTTSMITAVLVQLKLIHYINKHNIHFLNHVLP